MSEPSTRAEAIESISPGILHWTVYDNRINNRSDSYAVEIPEGTVLIDPLPISDEELKQLSNVIAICLTGRFHQRSSWRYQYYFGVSVYAPHNGELHEPFAGKPDRLYRPGDLLPGGLEVKHTPGPSEDHYSFYLPRKVESVFFSGDLLIRENADEHFRFVPDQFMVDPQLTRESVRNLLEMDIGLLCPNHGAYAQGNVHKLIEEALDKDNSS
jgi:hypothetical protein